MQKAGIILLRKEKKTGLLVKYSVFSFRLSFEVSTNTDNGLNTKNYLAVNHISKQSNGNFHSLPVYITKAKSTLVIKLGLDIRINSVSSSLRPRKYAVFQNLRQSKIILKQGHYTPILPSHYLKVTHCKM